MKSTGFVVALVAGLAGGALGGYLFAPKGGEATAKTETAYERVMRTKTLRCGYAMYGAWTMRDPNSGQISGFMHDLSEQMGRDLGLKVEWTAEIGYGDIEEALRSNKFDVFCSGAMITPKRATYSTQTIPVNYNGLVVWVRADDHRFDNDLGKLNDPAMKVSTRDGDLADTVANDSFPKAQRVASPQLTDFSQMLMDVKTGKADAAFFDLEFGERFLAKNPGSIRALFVDKPVLMGPNTMMLPMNEPQLKNMLDATLLNLHLRGEVVRLAHKYLGEKPYYWYAPAPVRQ